MQKHNLDIKILNGPGEGSKLYGTLKKICLQFKVNMIFKISLKLSEATKQYKVDGLITMKPYFNK